MAYTVGGVASVRLTLTGQVLDHVLMGCNELSTTQADDEASRCSVTFTAEGALADARFVEGAKIKVEYGWNGQFYPEAWEGTLESTDPKSEDGQESISLNFYGPSFQLRNANAPQAVRGTNREAAERLIRKYGLTADVRVGGTTATKALKDSSSAWEVLEGIARLTNSVVLERGPSTIYLGPKPEQEVLLEFHYKEAPAGISPTVTGFSAHWTRYNRPQRVTVVGVDRRRNNRFQGIWEAGEKDTDRDGEVSVYLPVSSQAEARARAERIGRRGNARSRTSEITVPIVPVTNGDIVRLMGAQLGRFAGPYYVRKVERRHLEGFMTLTMEYNA
jgi:hypothetical protein